MGGGGLVRPCLLLGVRLAVVQDKVVFLFNFFHYLRKPLPGKA